MTFNFEPAYKVDIYPGIAFRADGYEMMPDEDTEWSGYHNPTGRILAHMIGDDRTFAFEPEELTATPDDEYCSGCGQIGCGWC